MKNLNQISMMQVALIIGGALLLNKLLKAKVGIVLKDGTAGQNLSNTKLPVGNVAPVLPATQPVQESSIPIVVPQNVEIESPINTKPAVNDYFVGSYQNDVRTTNEFFN